MIEGLSPSEIALGTALIAAGVAWGIAKATVHQCQTDIETIKSSVKYVFELFFWEECLSDCDIEEIAKEIEFVI